MEDFKDVMLSEPPQRFAGGQPSHVTSNALSLESYKGILLCDRPADARANRTSNQLPPFLPPGNTDLDRGNGNLGLPPSLETRARNQLSTQSRTTGVARPGETIARSSKAALTKHRKWLSSFAGEMKKMKEQEKDVQYRAAVREATLRDREAAKRRGEGSLVNSNAPRAVEYEQESPASAAPAAREENVADHVPTPPPPQSKPAKKKGGAGKKKPKWAMTEQEAEDAEFDEARDLMDFAAELDFDAFVKDFEVQEALAIMRDRVKEIAEEKGIDIDEARRQRAEAADDDDDDAASVITTSTVARARAAGGGAKAVKARRAAEADGEGDDNKPAWNDSTSTTIRKALQGDAMKLAEKVLQSSDQLRKVHSKASMARLLEDAAMEVGAIPGSYGTAKGRSAAAATSIPSEAMLVPPRIATVAAEATGDAGNVPQPAKRVLTEMRQSKSKAQNLPYLYRCPSI